MARSKSRRYGAGFVAICASLWPISYAYIVTSAPYEVATNVVRQSPEVLKELGPVLSVRLSPFGYSAGLGGGDSYADLQLSITGQRAAGEVEIYLDRKGLGSTWRVSRATLLTANGKR